VDELHCRGTMFVQSEPDPQYVGSIGSGFHRKVISNIERLTGGFVECPSADRRHMSFCTDMSNAFRRVAHLRESKLRSLHESGPALDAELATLTYSPRFEVFQYFRPSRALYNPATMTTVYRNPSDPPTAAARPIDNHSESSSTAHIVSRTSGPFPSTTACPRR
jgi:hypothetical protein